MNYFPGSEQLKQFFFFKVVQEEYSDISGQNIHTEEQQFQGDNGEVS